jgi:hypothetical protein
MFLKKLKHLIKLKLPFLALVLIKYRDSNFYFRKLNNIFFILNKNVHGKKIIKTETGILIDLSINNFVSHTIRPKNNENIEIEDEEYNNDSTAIIIQGSIYGIKTFVIETIKLYKKLFSKTTIILSIWNDEIDSNFLSICKELQIEIIINKKVKTLFNTNLQIISTSSGLDLAKKLNKKFTLKTRTDCRIYKKNSIQQMKNLLKIFPLDMKFNFLKNRIISCSIDTRKYRVYGLSDILMFSLTDNLINYFKNEDFEQSLDRLNMGKHPVLINETIVINEIFLCARYLMNNDIKIDWSLEDWWNKCRDIFCVIDAKAIDFFWYKYHWKYEQRFESNYTSNFNQAMSFSDWLNLYCNKDYNFNMLYKEKWLLKNGLILQND